MAEYIEREPLLEILEGFYDHHLTMGNYSADGATQDCIDAVINSPTADVVPVVRCKDCKYWEQGKDYEPYCNHWAGMMTDSNADDFCSHGERKDNG